MAKFEITDASIPDVKIIQPRKFADDRGYFVETYSRSFFDASGLNMDFVQDNQSMSLTAGTLRGLHFQTPPFAQAKLVRVIQGRVWDVAIDIRRASSTFGQWFGLELSAENQLQLLVPVGFAHGFLTLEADTIVAYKVTALYSAANDAGIAWNEPSLAIDWPLPTAQPLLSDKDRALPLLLDTGLFD